LLIVSNTTAHAGWHPGVVLLLLPLSLPLAIMPFRR